MYKEFFNAAKCMSDSTWKKMVKFKQIFESEYFIKNTYLPCPCPLTKQTIAQQQQQQHKKQFDDNEIMCEIFVECTVLFTFYLALFMRFRISEIYLAIDQGSTSANGTKNKSQKTTTISEWTSMLACERESCRASFTKYLFMRKTILTMYGRNFMSCFPKYLV